MHLAPMPDHGRVNRPEWQALWMQYEAVTTPLRSAGLPCDIETCGGQTVITVELPDGSHLAIADADALPNRLADVTGWRVVRAHHDNPTIGGPVYDSTEDGEYAQHGADIAQMLAALAIHLVTLPDEDTKTRGQVLGDLLSATPDLYSVMSVGVGSQHYATKRLISGPIEGYGPAMKEYGWQTHLLEGDGWKQVHESGGTTWPVTVWERRGVIQTVFLARIARLAR